MKRTPLASPPKRGGESEDRITAFVAAPDEKHGGPGVHQITPALRQESVLLPRHFGMRQKIVGQREVVQQPRAVPRLANVRVRLAHQCQLSRIAEKAIEVFFDEPCNAFRPKLQPVEEVRLFMPCDTADLVRGLAVAAHADHVPEHAGGPG